MIKLSYYFSTYTKTFSNTMQGAKRINFLHVRQYTFHGVFHLYVCPTDTDFFETKQKNGSFFTKVFFAVIFVFW